MDAEFRRLQREAQYDPEAAKKFKALKRRTGQGKRQLRQQKIDSLLARASLLQPNVQLNLSQKKTPEGEYRITWKVDGKYDPNKTYYTDDFDDALATLQFIVERMGPKKNPDPERDSFKRQDARRHYEKLVAALQRPKISQYFEAITLVFGSTEIKGMALPWYVVDPKIGPSDPLYWLEIIFSYEQKGNAKASFIPPINTSSMAIVIFDAKYSAFHGYQRALEEARTSFIHEFVHLQDSLRYKRKKLSYIKSDDPRYFTTPSEFNAYYQAGFDALETTFESHLRWTPESLRAFLNRQSGNDSFVGTAKAIDAELVAAGKLLCWDNIRFGLSKFWHESFIAALRTKPTWFKRFLKRLRVDFEAWSEQQRCRFVAVDNALQDTVYFLAGDILSALGG